MTRADEYLDRARRARTLPTMALYVRAYGCAYGVGAPRTVEAEAFAWQCARRVEHAEHIARKIEACHTLEEARAVFRETIDFQIKGEVRL